MATRPAWTIKDGVVIKENFDFVWNGGFSVTQKQKNINALHQAIRNKKVENSIDISSKSTVQIGKDMSAFSLKLSGRFWKIYFRRQKSMNMEDLI